MNKHIYIDLGANVGDTVARYLVNNNDSVIFAFEPNPSLANSLKERFRGESVTIIEKASWTEDGTAPLYLGDILSSTLMLGKKHNPQYPQYTITYEDRAEVATVDFSRWLSETVSEDDYVVIKMDIEGAEYPVLNRMIDKGTIELVDVLKCEFHQNRFPISLKEHEQLIKTLEKKTKLMKWK